MLEPGERLRNAIIEGNLSITKRILYKYPELWLNINPKNGWNNLHYSSYNGNYLICFYLITFINQAKEENEDLANILNNHNDMLSYDKLSPLHLTIINSHLQTLHYLLQEFPGAYWLNHQGGENKQTPLHYCCVYGFGEGLKLLLEKGADYNIVDKDQNNLMHLAFEYGNFECIQIFMEYLHRMGNVSNGTKTSNSKLIKSFENSKNSKGWLPIELSINFKLTKDYKAFKLRLLSAPSSSNNSELGESVSRASFNHLLKDSFESQSILNSSSTNLRLDADTNDDKGNGSSNTGSSSPNKILSSPIISLNEFQKRAHSQSLPTQVEEDIPLIRQRASTSVTQPLPPVIPPATPVIRKTPSLKSITISPSIRLNTDIDEIEVESASSSTTTNSSPLKMLFPAIKSVSSRSEKTPQNRSRSQSAITNEETISIDSPSSIAAKLAFNGSLSSHSSRKNSDNSPVKMQLSGADSTLRNVESASNLVSSPKSTAHSSPIKKTSINSISFSRVR